jgi:hypothetical protein
MIRREVLLIKTSDGDSRDVEVVPVRGGFEQLDGCSVNGATQSMQRRLSDP